MILEYLVAMVIATFFLAVLWLILDSDDPSETLRDRGWYPGRDDDGRS